MQQDILRVLLYFDIFNHPLRPEEIHTFLPSNSTNPAEITRACQADPLAALIDRKGSYFFLGTANASCTEERRRKEQLARRRWRTASFMAKLIGKFPFVRGVFVSGELSKGLASKRGDIDFVIVTCGNRLWICRTLLILFKKIFLLNSKKYFCLNHFVAEDHLEFEMRNVYSAIEIATLKPLVNLALFQKYMAANAWIDEFLPNWKVDEELRDHHDKKRSRIQRLLEFLFPTRIADHLDDVLMRTWQKVWKRRYAYLGDEQRERQYQCRKHISTAYGVDFLRKILEMYQLRLNRFELSSDSQAPVLVVHMLEHHG